MTLHVGDATVVWLVNNVPVVALQTVVGTPESGTLPLTGRQHNWAG